MSELPGGPPTPGWTSPSGAQPQSSQPPPAPPGFGPQPGGWGQQPPPGYGPGYGPGSGPPPGSGPGSAWGRAIKPGIIALRPLAVGEILDGAFTSMRRYPKATLGLSAIVASVSTLAQLVLVLTARNSAGDPFDARVLVAIALSLLISGLAGLVLTGMLTIVIGEAVLGRPVQLGQVWARLRPRMLSLIGAPILVGLTVLLGFLALILPGIYLAVALAFTTPVLILEGQTITAAMGRSRELVKGDWWRVFGIIILAGMIAFFVSSVIALPFSAATQGGNAFGFGAPPVEVSTGSLLIQAVGQIVAKTVTAPITAGVTVLLYIDRRMRREGLDVALARTAAPAARGPGW